MKKSSHVHDRNIQRTASRQAPSEDVYSYHPDKFGTYILNYNEIELPTMSEIAPGSLALSRPSLVSEGRTSPCLPHIARKKMILIGEAGKTLPREL